MSFVGWCSPDQMAAHYAAADVFVLPSLDEGMSNVILEAMASGLPVVATAIPGNAELVQPGQNGYLVPPRDPAALAEALRPLLLDADLRQRLGRDGRRRAGDYSWHSVARRYLALLEQLTPPPARN